MCFSATASFAAFGLLTSTGAAAMRRSMRQRLGLGMIFLSSFPLVFGFQQGFEGLVWLGIEDVLPMALRGLGTYGFLFFALTYWPIAGPVAGYLIETRPVRRKCFLALIIAGIVIGFYLMFMAIKHPVPPMAGPVWRGHIAYLVGVELPQGIEYLYFFTACLALLGSSDRAAFRFGLALTVSFAVTMMAYQLETLPSVWCFFAAFCSLIIVHAVWRRDTQAETLAAVGEK